MLISVTFSVLFAFLVGVIFVQMAIRTGHLWGLLDIPSSRRQHPNPVPVIGGVAVVVTMFAGLTMLALLRRGWAGQNFATLVVFCFSIVILMTLGLVDDLKGLSPKPKLLVQLLVSAGTIYFEPDVSALCRTWAGHFGGFLVYPLVVLWIIGITNALNLIDGLDGLAASFALLASVSLGCLAIVFAPPGGFLSPGMLVLSAALLAFLAYNWHPARIFLGDNGSLSIGYLLSVSCLKLGGETGSLLKLGGFVLIFTYPILEMGLSTLRRIRSNNPIFKADRNHLHYRLQRLGLPPQQTVLVLISTSVCLALSALSVSFLHPGYAVLFLGTTVLGFCQVLFLIQTAENIGVRKIAKGIDRRTSSMPGGNEVQAILHISIAPLLEAGLKEEKHRVTDVISSLKLLVASSVRKTDQVVLKGKEISIHFFGKPIAEKDLRRITKTIRRRLAQFKDMYNLAYTLDSLPIRAEKLNPSRALSKKKKAA